MSYDREEEEEHQQQQQLFKASGYLMLKDSKVQQFTRVKQFTRRPSIYFHCNPQERDRMVLMEPLLDSLGPKKYKSSVNNKML